MAHSKSFFGLRRGSTKSLTFSVLNGKQVTKDRVSVVANPRTSKQMYQRAIFATVATSAKAMKFIIDHSFENVKEGNDSIREFRKLNLKKLRNYVAATGDNAAASVGAKLQPAGYPWVTPNPWIMSKGSLPSLPLFANLVRYPEIGGAPCVGLQTFTLSALEANATFGDLMSALGIGAHDQITLCALDAGDDGTLYYESADAAGCQANENDFKVRRVVMNVDATELAKPLSEFVAMSAADFANYIAANCVDADKTDNDLLLKLFSLVVENNQDSTFLVTRSPVNQIESDMTKAACIIRSRQVDGKWQYSNATMFVVEPDDTQNYGLTPADAIATYTASANVGQDMNPFLDEGGTGGNNEDFQ